MKIPPKIKPNDLIEVTWIDANSPSGTWISESEWNTLHPKMEMTSVGYFCKIENGYISLIADRSITEEYVALISRGFNIPMGCVQKIRKLK